MDRTAILGFGPEFTGRLLGGFPGYPSGPIREVRVGRRFGRRRGGLVFRFVMCDLHCMVRRVALTFAQSLGVGLAFAVAARGVWAQSSGSPAPASVAAPASEPVDTSLSPECR